MYSLWVSGDKVGKLMTSRTAPCWYSFIAEEHLVEQLGLHSLLVNWHASPDSFSLLLSSGCSATCSPSCTLIFSAPILANSINCSRLNRTRKPAPKVFSNARGVRMRALALFWQINWGFLIRCMGEMFLHLRMGVANVAFGAILMSEFKKS